MRKGKTVIGQDIYPVTHCDTAVTSLTKARGSLLCCAL